MNTATGITLTLNSATQRAPLGSCVEEEHETYGLRVWRYVKAGAALAAGNVCKLANASVSWDVVLSTADATLNYVPRLAGVAQHTISSGYYGYILVAGYGLVKADAGGISTPNCLMASATTAGTVDDFAAGTGAEERAFAFATADIAAGATGVAKISIPF